MYCTILSYIFAFVLEKNSYKIHGLWPETCKIGYPECCPLQQSKYFNQTEFVQDYWLNGLNKSKSSVCNQTVYYLYEHEAIKHGACINLSINDYVLKTGSVFEIYKNQLYTLCDQKDTCELSLDENFNLLD